MTISHIRLINGDEIIGVVDNKQTLNNHVIISEPLLVTEQTDQYGQTGIVLTKFSPWSNNTAIRLQQSHIISIIPVHQSVELYYKNSLILADRKTERLIKELDQVNATMEQQSTYYSIQQYDDDDEDDHDQSFQGKFIHAGSTANN